MRRQHGATMKLAKSEEGCLNEVSASASRRPGAAGQNRGDQKVRPRHNPAQRQSVQSLVGEECAETFAPSNALTMIAVSCAAFTATDPSGLATLTKPAPARSAPLAANLAAPVAWIGPLTTTA
jgi:hypothetical protein